MDERGQHGRRYPVVHQVIHSEAGRVLLQDMVLRFEALQVGRGVDRRNKRTFLFFIKRVMLSFLSHATVT